ncbi:MAG: uncharacterized membrane protein YkvA (DUF1232 family) [Oleispira sp.]|jgi:uncharacterized membrane protein YkvA (DUF1232 family)
MVKSSHEFTVDKAKKSKAYSKAKSNAENYVNNPQKLNDLIEVASKKANHKKGPLEAVWIKLMACFRLIKAYAKGTYREIPWTSLVMIVASVIYFVMPVDLIPDFFLFSGFIDDAALLGWTVKTFSSDIDAFVEWESHNASAVIQN